MPLGWRRWSGALALCFGLALRAVFVWKHPQFVGDTLVYGDLAHNLLAHRVYGLTEEGHVRATLIRLPGYPLFLAGCFAVFGTGSYLPVVWSQVLVDLLGCWLLGGVARQLFGERTGLFCLWMAALCPFTANYAAAALTETLSIFCVVVALSALMRCRSRAHLPWAGLVGVSLCGAALLRPDGVLLAVAVLPAMAWIALCADPRSEARDLPGRGRTALRWRGLGVAAGLLVACLGLWTLRNWRLYHVFQPLAPKYANDPGEGTPWGFARWYRTWGTGLGDTARVYWEYDGSALRLRDLPSWAIDSPAQRCETERVYAQYNADTSSTPAVEGAFSQLAAERVRAHPVRSLLIMPLLRLADMWFRPRTELLPHMPVRWWSFRQRPGAAWFALGYGLLNAALLVCAGTGLWRWRHGRWHGNAVIAAAMVGYVLLRSALLVTIDNSEPRYVLEAYPVVLILAAYGVARLADRIKPNSASAGHQRL